MTDRAPSGQTLPNACPFLALEEDRDRRSAVADGRHRCYAEPAPQPRALTYQETYCLSPAFAACRSFLDWAARAAAEPVTGQNRAVGAAQPLAPIPGPTTPAPAPPMAGGRPPLNPILPPAPGLPPAPAGYTPPPAWQPPAPIPAAGPGAPPPPGWQPPGSPPADTTGFTWATPPPWVGQPEMRTTAGLPDSARPPLDAERLGWTSAGRAGTLPPPPLDEDGTDAYPEWPPAPRSASVSGTFATRRSEPFAPLPGTGADVAGIADAPPLAALVAGDLDLDPDAGLDPAADVEADVEAGADPWIGEDRVAAPGAPVASSTAEEADERWIGEDRAAPGEVRVAPAATAPTGSVPGSASETAAWSTWAGTVDAPDPRPSSASEPVAIKVGDGPSGATPSGAGAWQGVIRDPDDGRAPVESVPPSSASSPSDPPPAVPPDVTSGGGRRSSTSRWLPSFLSRDPHEETGTAVVARTGPAAALPAATDAGADPWIEDGLDGGTGSRTGTGAAAAVMAAPVSAASVTATRPATGSVPAVSAPDADAVPDVDEDPPGSLAPRRRRQRPGVPLDASAPTARPAQTRPATRTKGSGEWNQPRTATSGSGWRRFIPGGLPPLLLGAGALFLGALALFLLPGMLAGGGDTATPAPTIEIGGGVAASLGPEASLAPVETDPPAGAFELYVVERGDTLIDIARRFTVSQEVLICANRELRRNPNLLSVGQELQIPPEDWTCPSQAKPTKKPGKKAPASEVPAPTEVP